VFISCKFCYLAHLLHVATPLQPVYSKRRTHLAVLSLLQGMSDEEVAVEMAPGPDDPQPLSAEEEEERQALMREGFSGWNRWGACTVWGDMPPVACAQCCALQRCAAAGEVCMCLATVPCQH
jgi:hypothetical protein